MKHEKTVTAEYHVHVPYKELLKLIGVPKDAEVTYIEGDGTDGLHVWYEK